MRLRLWALDTAPGPARCLNAVVCSQSSTSSAVNSPSSSGGAPFLGARDGAFTAPRGGTFTGREGATAAAGGGGGGGWGGGGCGADGAGSAGGGGKGARAGSSGL